MAQRRVKLGDVVDDYCSRCKLLMNHGVMALDGETILKVRCNTCMSEHKYRQGKGSRKADPVKAAYEALISRMPAGTVPEIDQDRKRSRPLPAAGEDSDDEEE